jgi:Gluconate 2-dehydrogenase subunit 3
MSVDPPVAGPQAEPAVVQEPPAAIAPLRLLDDAQRSLLRFVLNRVIPPHGELSGAGDLGAGATIERTLVESPRLRRLFLDGLKTIEVSAPRPFVELSEAAQTAVLQRVEHSHPAFFTALVDHTYRAYYTLPEVQQSLGWYRPPQPLGHTLPPFDPSLLAQQRTRAPFWRRPA